MKTLLVICTALFLSGCANTPKTDRAPSQAWLDSIQGLKNLNVWEAITRSSINHHVYHFSGTLTQQTRPEMDLLSFRLAPTGDTIMAKMYPSGEVITVMPDGQTLRGKDVNTLLYQAAQIRLPASELKHWLLGIVPAGAPHNFKENGELAGFEYNDWKVEYGPLDKKGPYLLPKVILLSHGDLTRIKIVVQSWQIPNCPCNK